jgi:hypothetical protein
MRKRLFGAAEGKVKKLSEENKVLCGTALYLQNICEDIEPRLSEHTETFESKQSDRRKIEFLSVTSFREKTRCESINDGLAVSLLRSSAARGHFDAHCQFSLSHRAGEQYLAQSANGGDSFAHAAYG